jgi:phage baseplate assembly protein V
MTDPFIQAETDRRLAALLLVGTVESVNYGDSGSLPRCRVRVATGLSSGEDWISPLIPWPVAAGGSVRHWCPPEIGEQVLIANPSGHPALGYIIGRYYSAQHGQGNAHDGHSVTWTMPDGCQIAYDHQLGALSVVGAKTVALSNSETITLDSGGAIAITAPSLTLSGDLTVEGSATISGDTLIHKGVDVGYLHLHLGVQPGDGISGPPVGSPGGGGGSGGSGIVSGDGMAAGHYWVGL